MRSLRFVFVVVVLCLPAVFVGGGQVSAQGMTTDIVFEQRTTANSVFGGPRIPQPFLSTLTYPRSNLALNADNATVSSARANYDVGYIDATFQASSEVSQLFADETSFTIPRGWTVADFAAKVDGGRRFLSWECDADGHSATLMGNQSDAFRSAAAGDPVSQDSRFQFLPYARELIETKDMNNDGDTEDAGETRTRCIAPEGLSTVFEWGGVSFGTGDFTYAAYTPTDDWEITPESMATPVYIVPTEPLVYRQAQFGLVSGGDRSTRADYTVPISGTFEVMVTLDSSIVRRDLNGFGAISTTCSGGRDSADSPDTMEFCTITAVNDVFEPVIADGDLPTFSPQAGASASLVNCGFAVNNQCRDISSNAEASGTRTLAGARTLAANTVQDFVLKPRSGTTLSQVELALGVPFVGAPPNSADSIITVELARDYTARAGYTVGTVTATGTSVRAIDENDVELALKPCSSTSTETCLEITLNSVYVTAEIANPIYAITVTNTSNQQNTIYTR